MIRRPVLLLISVAVVAATSLASAQVDRGEIVDAIRKAFTQNREIRELLDRDADVQQRFEKWLNAMAQEQLDALRQTVYDLQGEIHQPRYLKLVWKDFAFNCILSEMKVSFSLFDAEGAPIRAKLGCTFLNYKETERRVREELVQPPFEYAVVRANFEHRFEFGILLEVR